MRLRTLRTLAHFAVVLGLVSIGVTFLIDLTPGDPAYAILGTTGVTQEQVDEVHRELNLDDPFWQRYFAWGQGLVSGDFGDSYISDRPVRDLIVERAAPTIELVALALIIALLISVPVGVYTALRQDRPIDRIWSGISSAIVAVPPFVSALILVFIFSVNLSSTPFGFPASGWSFLENGISVNLWFAVLPAVTLALLEIPSFSKALRSDMIATLQEDFILSARARGFRTSTILFRYALRPSSSTLVARVGLSFATLLGGVVVVETLFGIPGLGQLLIQSVSSKDFPVVQGMVMLIAIFYVLTNLFVEGIQHWIDPRLNARRAA